VLAWSGFDRFAIDFWDREIGQIGEPGLARRAFLNVLNQPILLRRLKSVSQKCSQLVVGGTIGHESYYEKRDYPTASSFLISSWSIFCTLLFATYTIATCILTFAATSATGRPSIATS